MRAQMPGHAVGHRRLSAKPARLVNLLAKSLRRRPEHLEQTRGQQLRPAQQRARLVRGQRGQCGHHGRSVDQREAFLALQDDRLQAVALQGLRGREPFFAGADVSQTDQQPRHVRQRREVAAGSNRTFARNFRKEVAIERGDEQFDNLRANAGKSARHGVGPRRHDGPGFRRGKQFALPDGKMVQQVQLMLLQVLRRNAGAAQRAEAGIDAVNRAWFGRQFFHQRPALAHPAAGVCRQAGCLTLGNAPQRRNGERMAV